MKLRLWHISSFRSLNIKTWIAILSWLLPYAKRTLTVHTSTAYSGLRFQLVHDWLHPATRSAASSVVDRPYLG